MLRVGGHVFPRTAQDASDPEVLARLAKAMGYTAVYAPEYLSIDRPDEIRHARHVFERERLIVAEVGYWENPLDTRPDVRKAVRDEMIRRYQMAEELGAKCVVNTAGSYCEGQGYMNHNPRNFSDEHFDDAVDMARYFIDSVRPANTTFAYEVFMYNTVDSPENYARLIRAVDRKMFGAHIDLTNMMRSPRELYMGRELTERCVRLFGDRIVSAHIKDARLVRPAITTMIEERIPGEGEADLEPFIVELHKLPHVVPMMMEHLKDEAEYARGFRYIQRVANKHQLNLGAREDQHGQP